ncbi:MAG TPA: hypothetical protein ENJ82_00730 [Bacteroidetes bacterium]|nr:hypothetical protein [Bacteroidota bacterium]
MGPLALGRDQAIQGFAHLVAKPPAAQAAALPILGPCEWHTTFPISNTAPSLACTSVTWKSNAIYKRSNPVRLRIH